VTDCNNAKETLKTFEKLIILLNDNILFDEDKQKYLTEYKCLNWEMDLIKVYLGLTLHKFVKNKQIFCCNLTNKTNS
jgi:hypothetical protein